MPWRTAFPSVLPTVSVDELRGAGGSSLVVVCEELQWWSLVPRAGEWNAMVWYDRESGEPTMVRESGVCQGVWGQWELESRRLLAVVAC